MLWALKVPSLKSFYETPLDDTRREWRRIGAIEKASNVRDAISATGEGDNIENILEVGAGTGAILDELIVGGYAKNVMGVEVGYSTDRKSYFSSGGAEIIYFNGVKIPFEDDKFDFVYASHVLEHVVEERAFLHELRRVSRRWVYVEVPCELTVRTSSSSLQRSLNIGHINSFTPESFALRLETSGLSVKNIKIRDVSFETISFERNILKSRIIHYIRRISLRFIPKFASRIFVFHAGALCEKGNIMDISLVHQENAKTV